MNILNLMNANQYCPFINIGDRFYKKPFPPNLPDLIEVVDIEEDIPGHWIITGRYIYHSIGQNIRKFSSDIFKDEKWIIKKKER